jgi:hypothetical protein
MKRERLPRHVLKWTPQGQRSRDRPIGTWRRTYETEQENANRTNFEIEGIELCGISLSPLYGPLGATRIDDDAYINCTRGSCYATIFTNIVCVLMVFSSHCT